MKISKPKIHDKRKLREQILHSALASFQIEGINISKEKAFTALKNIEISLEK